jgi:hypothetical protein
MKLVKGYRDVAGNPAQSVEGFGAMSRRELLAKFGASAAIFSGVGDAMSGDPADKHAAPGDGSGDLPPEYQGYPVFLSGSATIQPKGTADVNNEALRNPYDFPIEIHEIRFMAWGSHRREDVATGRSSPASQLSVNLALEDAIVTKDYVSLHLICPGQPRNAETLSFIATTVQSNSATSHKVALKTPLILRPREVMRCSFNNAGLISGSPQDTGSAPGEVTAYVAYLGRTRQDLAIGQSRVVPYFAGWSPVALVQPASGLPASTESDETNLMNQAPEPVRIARIIGRLSSAIFDNSPTQQANTITEFTDSPLSFITKQRPGPDAVTVQMFRSNGIPIIAPGTPFRMAFDASTRSWEIDNADMVLESADYFKATVQLLPPSGGNTVKTPQMFAAIGITGYREVAL